METSKYIVVLDWMVTELELRGNELLVYALIYGFSQDGESEFTGSIQYITERTGIARRTVIDILHRLTAREIIVKREVKRNNVMFCTYRAKFAQGVQKLHRGGAETILGGSAEIAPNNKDIDNKDNNKDKKDISKDISKKGVEKALLDMGVDGQVLADYMQLRRAKRLPLTETAIRGIEREAQKAGVTINAALQICCECGWAGFRADWYNNRQSKSSEREKELHQRLYIDPETDYGDYEREWARRAALAEQREKKNNNGDPF